MKTRRFLAYLAIAAVGCGFAVSCDDNDEPTDPRINDPYNTTQFIFINTISEDKSQTTGGGQPLLFEKEGFYDYSTILTYYDGGYSYEVFIPAEGGKLTLTDQPGYNWFIVSDLEMGDTVIPFEEQNLGNENSSGSWYYFSKSNDYLTIDHLAPEELEFTIAPNPDKKERKMSVYIREDAPVSIGINMIFVQQGQE